MQVDLGGGGAFQRMRETRLVCRVIKRQSTSSCSARSAPKKECQGVEVSSLTGSASDVHVQGCKCVDQNSSTPVSVSMTMWLGARSP